jgi:hypothetical protein
VYLLFNQLLSSTQTTSHFHTKQAQALLDIIVAYIHTKQAQALLDIIVAYIHTKQAQALLDIIVAYIQRHLFWRTDIQLKCHKIITLNVVRQSTA